MARKRDYSKPENNRWIILDGAREECARLQKAGMSSAQIASRLNEIYWPDVMKRGLGAFNSNIVIGEIHRDRIRERRRLGLIQPRKPADPKPEPFKADLSHIPWADKPLYAGIRIPTRQAKQDIDEDEEA